MHVVELKIIEKTQQML
eukprot:gene17053-22563_t